LKMGVMYDFFQLSGKIPDSKELLNSKDNGNAKHFNKKNRYGNKKMAALTQDGRKCRFFYLKINATYQTIFQLFSDVKC
jgi:hypothetical protein